MIEKVGCRIVCDKNIHQTITVKVAAAYAQSVVTIRIGHAGLFGDVGKCAVAFVMVKRIPGSGQAPWPTLYWYSFELAGTSLAKFGQVVDIEVYVVGDKEVELSIVVVIDECGSRRPASITDFGSLRNVSEGAVPIVS